MLSSSDQNLLFGIIALQMDFVRREQLVAATSAWLANKSLQIDEILVKQGALNESDRQLLAPLVARHLENHGGNSRQSLAALSSIGSVAEDLRLLGDESIEATLSMVTGDQSDNERGDTIADESRASKTVDATARNATHARFQILRPHAKGGLGQVYVATDTELNREVALKEIQNDYADDESSRLRFLLEAEVTGGLEHPGIVPVYGLGQYENGRPYYAMRFIKGDSLREAADRFHGRGASDNKTNDSHGEEYVETKETDFGSLEFRKLLGRFIDVCQAIEYAHSRGVLHRDLKPGNIMLGKYGETLVVDWGLAKAQGRNIAGKVDDETTLRPASASGTAPTILGSAIGTPAFMPPEQAAGRIDELGPASDVYSLGATLYFLLVGEVPFAGKEVRAVLENVKKGILKAPCDRQSRVPKALEAVCLKAMSLQAEQRYGGPQELADEIERYLGDEPVLAMKEPMVERARRWVRKHKTLTSTTIGVVFVSIVGMSVLSVIVSGKNVELSRLNSSLDFKNSELVSANKELDANNTALTIAKREAETNREEAEAVNAFLRDRVFAVARPKATGGQGPDAKLRDALYASEEYLESSFSEKPLLEQSIRATLGQVYAELTDYDRAVTHLQRCLTLCNDLFGEADKRTLLQRNMLSSAMVSTQPENAEAFIGETLQLCRQVLGEDNEHTVFAYTQMGRQLHRMGDSQAAIELLSPVVQNCRQALTWENPDYYAKLCVTLGIAYDDMGRKEKAFEMIREEIAFRSKNSEENSYSMMLAKSSAAWRYWRNKQPEKAIPLYEEILEWKKGMLNKDSDSLLATQWNLGVNYADVGRFDKALPLLESVYRNGMMGREIPVLQKPHRFYSSNIIDYSVRAKQYERGAAFAWEALQEELNRLDPASPAHSQLQSNFLRDMIRLRAWGKAKAVFRLRLETNPKTVSPLFVDSVWDLAMKEPDPDERGKIIHLLDELLDLCEQHPTIANRHPGLASQHAVRHFFHGTKPAYRRICGALFEGHVRGDEFASRALLHAVFLDTEPEIHGDALLELAASVNTRKHHHFLGMARLRSGEFGAAIDEFKQGKKDNNGENKVWNTLGIAIASHHLHQTNEAKSWLNLVNKRVADLGMSKASAGMNKTYVEILLQEATQLIGKEDE